jgi:ATP-dependent DNA helicase RecQ
VRGRILAPFDGRARAAARTSAAEGGRARWRQYRAVWAFAEGDGCRRAAILEHFGDPAAPAPAGPCCDVCDPSLVPAPPERLAPLRGGAGGAAGAGGPGSLDDAILGVVRGARPSIGRTRVADVLRGGKAKVVLRNSWDGLPEYGTYAHLAGKTVLARVDALLADGRLLSTGGPYPVLREGASQPSLSAA